MSATTQPKHLQQKKPTPTQTTQPISGGMKQMHVGTDNPHNKNEVPTQQTSGGMKQTQVGTANPHTNLTNPHLTPTQPTQQIGGGRAQQQHFIASPTQLQQPSHKPLTPQQKRLQRQKTGYLPRIYCRKNHHLMGMTGIVQMVIDN